jgi:hypothetical protein
MLSPDIYVPNFTEWIESYVQSGNPLFIPESAAGARGMANAIWAMGRHNAMGYSPFGVDRSPTMDAELAKAYQFLSQMAPLILANQGTGKMTAVLVDKETPTTKVRLGDYVIEARFSAGRSPAPAVERVAGLFIQLGPDDYVIVGRNMGVYFESATDQTQSVGLGTVEEGRYVDGRWVAGRRLNGDETPEWKALWFQGDRYTIQKVKLYRYR